jgi:hypothetical protein
VSARYDRLLVHTGARLSRRLDVKKKWILELFGCKFESRCFCVDSCYEVDETCVSQVNTQTPAGTSVTHTSLSLSLSLSLSRVGHTWLLMYFCDADGR